MTATGLENTTPSSAIVKRVPKTPLAAIQEKKWHFLEPATEGAMGKGFVLREIETFLQSQDLGLQSLTGNFLIFYFSLS